MRVVTAWAERLAPRWRRTFWLGFPAVCLIGEEPCMAGATDALDSLCPAALPTEGRLVQRSEIRFSEIISALSVALDITQGHPEGHCMRTALIGMRLAEELKLPAAEGCALFYALLLKDLGCSSNAAKIAYLFGADDQLVKRTARMIDWTRP